MMGTDVAIQMVKMLAVQMKAFSAGFANKMIKTAILLMPLVARAAAFRTAVGVFA